MRRKEEASKVKQTTKQCNTAHPRQPLFLYKHTYIYMGSCMYCRGRERDTHTPFHCSLPSLPGSSTCGIQGCPACPSEGEVTDTVCNQSTVEHRQYIADLWELVHGTFYLLQAEHVRSLVCDVLQSPILWNSFSHTKYPTPIPNTPVPCQIPRSHIKYPTPIPNTPVPHQIPHSHTKYPGHIY